MERVAQWISWHEAMSDVRLHDFRDWLFDGQQRQLTDEFQGFAFSRKIPASKFCQDGFTGNHVVVFAAVIPPQTSPFAPSYHFQLGPDFKIETRD